MMPVGYLHIRKVNDAEDNQQNTDQHGDEAVLVIANAFHALSVHLLGG